MAGKVRHFKERNGRYSARLVVPKNLRVLVGKAELEVQLGGDRRQALVRLPAAVAGLQAQIAVAERRAHPGESSLMRYPLSAEEIAVTNYRSMIALDQELRNQGPLFATLELDDGFVADLRAAISGRLDDEALDKLVGYRIERFQFRGNTDAVRGSPEWRELAIALCVSEYEALSRKVERDEGNYAGSPNHPLIANATVAPERLEPVPLLGLLDDYLKILEHHGKGREARRRWTPVFKDLARFVGHKDATRLTDEKLREWRDEKLKTLSAKTVADVYLASVRAVMTWAVREKKLATNPIADVTVRKIKRAFTREKGFRQDEAVAILKACRSYVPADRS